MDKFKILELIDSKINSKKEEFVFPDNYYYCKKRFGNTVSLDGLSFINCDIKDLVTCFHLINDESDIDESLKEINKLYNFFKYFSTDSLVDLHNLGLEAPAEKVEQFLNRNTLRIVNKSCDDLKNKSFFKTFKAAVGNVDEYYDGMETFMDLFKNNKSYLLYVLEIYISYYQLKDIWKHIDKTPGLKNKDKRRLLQGEIDRVPVYSLGIDAFNLVPKYINEMDNKKKEYDKAFVTRKRTLKYTKDKFLKVCDDLEITDYKDLISYVDDEELKKELLLYVYEKNCKYLEMLNNDISKYSNEKYSSIIYILNKYNISYDGNLSVFEYLNIDDFERIIDLLKKINLSDDVIMNILKNTSVDIVDSIKEYVFRGIINKDFINNNLDIFRNNDKLNRVVNNINYFQSNDINPYIFRNNSYILLQDNDINKNTIDILLDYNLIGSLKNTMDIKFFNDSELNNKIDTLLELGLEKYFEEDLRLLNYNNYDRIKLLKALGVEFDSIDSVIKVLENDKFIVEDNEISNYLPNSNIIMDEAILNKDLLDSYSNTSRTYKIGNVILSKRKINNLINDGNSLYNSIFDNNGYSIEDYDTITHKLSK